MCFCSLPKTHQLGALHSEEVREGDEEILDGRLTGGAPSSEGETRDRRLETGETGHSSAALCLWRAADAETSGAETRCGSAAARRVRAEPAASLRPQGRGARVVRVTPTDRLRWPRERTAYGGCARYARTGHGAGRARPREQHTCRLVCADESVRHASARQRLPPTQRHARREQQL